MLAGRFELRSELGSGSHGRVYLAIDQRSGLRVAAKVLHPSLAADRQVLARFAREAEAVGRIVHPHVVVLHALGEDRGYHFLVMEYVAGGTLAEHLESLSTPPPLAFVRSVTIQLLDALSAAHERQIVHRDLKPENVLMADVVAPCVKIADFGLARLQSTSMTTLTQADLVAGTVEFMSPEQCRSLRVGPAADLYSLGCMLTELLQLRPPFVGRTAAEVVAGHLFAEVDELRRPAELPPVPAALEQLRRELLAKQPHQRPPSAAAARARLLAIALPDERRAPRA